MSKKLYSIRDMKLGTFAPPCVFENDPTAMRAFGDLVRRDKDSMIHIHPEDFALYYLGEFDVERGVIAPVEPISICIASDFKE